MDRRKFLAGTASIAAAAAVSKPAIVQAQANRVIKFVPEADVVVFDPVVTPSAQTREHAWLIYDTLYGVDDKYNAHPQMAEGHVVENNGLTWKITLREGLKFHDGERVLARDAAASVNRWTKRDSFGQALGAATNEIVATSDRVLEIRLKKPFPLVPDALGKTMAFHVSGDAGAHCPDRPIQADHRSDRQRALQICRQRARAGRARRLRAVCRLRAAQGWPDRNDGRPEAPDVRSRRMVDHSGCRDGSGGIAARRDRLAADAAIRISFRRCGAMPTSPCARSLRSGSWPTCGSITCIRRSTTPRSRRAIIGAIAQSDYMIAINGTDNTLWKDDIGYFVPGSPLASNAGMEKLTGKRDLAKVKSDIEKSGYKGEKIAMMVAVDVPYLKTMGDVTQDLFKQIGLNLDYQAVDWTTVVQRRAKMDPPSAGGWNMYCINDNGVNQLNPASHFILRGNGKNASFGWPTSEKLEALRDQWFDAPNLDAQKKIAAQIQLQAFEDVPYIPLGQSIAPTAYRKDIVGVLNGQPTFWNVKRRVSSYRKVAAHDHGLRAADVSLIPETAKICSPIVIRRILATIPVMAVVAVFVFSLLYIAPGDPAAVIAGDQATTQDVERIREQLGLNRPFLEQFAIWSWNIDPRRSRDLDLHQSAGHPHDRPAHRADSWRSRSARCW